MSTLTAAADVAIEERRGGRRRGFAAYDAVIAVVLGIIAFVLRRHVPADGLFYDDAWQALGAWQGSISNIITVGQSQPGFTAGLMVWTRIFGSDTAALVAPAMIAGSLGPPALYLALRRFGFTWTIALLAGAALASAEVHIMFSYHVKTYTSDVLIMLGLALAVAHLARRHWRPSTAAAWFIGSVLVGSFSSIALIASAVAGLILVLHASGDRKLRVYAVAAQAVVLSALYLASVRTLNQAMIREFFAERDGFIEFDQNPINFGRDIFNHFWNVVNVYPGSVVAVALALAGGGLLATARRGHLVVPARFFALAIIVAAGGSVLRLVPFGPPGSFLGRVSLWLVPAIALGLCAALEFIRRQAAVRAPLRAGFDVVVFAAAVLVLVTAFGHSRGSPAAGARSATEYVMSHAGPDDVVLVTKWTTPSFALYADTPVDLRPTPEQSVGFVPTFSDGRLHPFLLTTTSEEFEDHVNGARRVHVLHANLNGPAQKRLVFEVAVGLSLRGFEHESTTTVGTGTIDAWHRATA